MTLECPKCGAAMVRRAGGRLWGCVHYPQCLGAQRAEANEGEFVPPTRSVTVARSEPSLDPHDSFAGDWELVLVLVSWDNGPVTGIATVTGHDCLFDRVLSDDPESGDADHYALWTVEEADLVALMAALAAPGRLLDQRTRIPSAIVGGTGYPDLLIDSSEFDRLWLPLYGRTRQEWPLDHMYAEFRPVQSVHTDPAVGNEHWVPLAARWSPV